MESLVPSGSARCLTGPVLLQNHRVHRGGEGNGQGEGRVRDRGAQSQESTGVEVVRKEAPQSTNRDLGGK